MNKIESFKENAPDQETLMAPEKVFDQSRFDKVYWDAIKLLRSEKFSKEGSKEEINDLSWEVAQNIEILDEALKVKSRFYGSLEVLNRLTQELGWKWGLRDVALSILEKNMPIIEGYIRNKALSFNYECLNAANNLFSYGDKEQMKIGMDILSGHIDAIEFSIKSENPRWYVHFLETIVVGGFL